MLGGNTEQMPVITRPEKLFVDGLRHKVLVEICLYVFSAKTSDDCFRNMPLKHIPNVTF